ncbi:MAG: hypothetical protein JSW20_14330 [Nitrospiraceae bacterium]|nr:MAG: hypothetical protein JSW20_14330 [Nitrospiraceae bacterium]
MKKCLYQSIMLCVIFVIKAEAATYKGIEFPQGSISFADSVVAYDPVINSGQPAATYRGFLEALGIPDYTEGTGVDYVSLGDGGSITLRFTDNYLTGSGDNADDLYIFEVGSGIEDIYVEISTDNDTWHSLGKVDGGTSGIDIDTFGFGINDLFSYVRLTDDADEGSQTGNNVGADIDAIGAISTTLATKPMNSPPSIVQLISPVNNTVNMQTTIEFRWEKSLDPDGDDVIYSHSLCIDENFTTGCITNENIASLDKKGIYYAGTGMSILLFGAVFSGARRFRYSFILLSAIIVFVPLILISCGGGKGSGNVNGLSQNEVSFTITGIESNTIYFWKVTASDNNGNASESEVRSFTTR